MNFKILSFLIFSIFLLSFASAMTVYADFSDSSQSATINVGDSISFNVDFFSMNPPMTSIKAGLYSGDSLIHSFLDSSSSTKTYYYTYTYTATSAGTYKIKVIGTDNTNTDSEFLTLTIHALPTPINHAPHITTSPSTQVNENTAYNYNVDATDEDSDTLTYSLTTAPSWLSINSATGVISGVAPLVSANTDYDVAVKVSDSHSATDTQTYTLTVKNIPCPVNHAPVITSSPIDSVDEGTSYTYHVTATDSDGDALTYSLTSAPTGLSMVPPWLSIDSVTGVISGTAPSVSADILFTVTVKVRDEHGAIDTQSYTLTVKNILCPPVNHAPVITSSPVKSIIEGNIYNYNVDATDSDGDDLTYSLLEGPDWLYINPNSGEITGTAPLVSSNTYDTVEIEVSDGNGGIDTQTYTLRVKDTNEEDDDDECDDCTSTRVIPDNSEDQNKYLNQFKPKDIVYSDSSTTQKVSKLSVLILFYIILAIIGLGIIIAFFLIFRNIRR
jgi:hypothetical protein